MLGHHRSCGLLLHPSSLPGRYGMGEIGPEALHWLAVLSRADISAWEMLALGPTPASGSPQCCLSDFAGNPLLISFDALRLDGVLLRQDVAMLPHFNNARVDYESCAEVRTAFLRLAAQRLLAQCASSPLLGHAFEAFCDREAEWLDDWALFAALRDEHEGRAWQEWPSDIASRDSVALANAIVRLDTEADEHRALQFLFARQWLRMRAHAHDLGIRLMAELPLGVAEDSADAWACPALLKSADGPEALAWWRARLAHYGRRFDALRVPGGALPAAVLAALQADSDVPLPLLMETADDTCGPSVCLRELMAEVAPSAEAPAWHWRFTWDALTPEVEARLAGIPKTHGV